MPGTPPVFMACQDKSSPALRHGPAVEVEVRTGYFFGSPDHDAIGALDAVAAGIEGDEEIIIPLAIDNKCCLDGVVHGPSGKIVSSPVQRIRFSGFGVEMKHLDPVPERAQCQIDRSIPVNKSRRVDRVEIGLVRGRVDHLAMIDPFVAGIRRVQGGVGGQTCAGPLAAEGGNRIIQVILAVEIRNIRRPYPPCSRYFLFRPVRNRPVKHCADALPVDEVF